MNKCKTYMNNNLFSINTKQSNGFKYGYYNDIYK